MSERGSLAHPWRRLQQWRLDLAAGTHGSVSGHSRRPDLVVVATRTMDGVCDGGSDGNRGRIRLRDNGKARSRVGGDDDDDDKPHTGQHRR
uniref:DUF834 domain-containing protein n=1 Tax=Oryza brachyantha TaxID=4533 RepID=J3LVR4_ORYBR